MIMIYRFMKKGSRDLVNPKQAQIEKNKMYFYVSNHIGYMGEGHPLVGIVSIEVLMVFVDK